MKLIYYADRKQFIVTGIPITGDRQFAMKLGPVPSRTLDLVDGDDYGFGDNVYTFIKLVNRSVSLVADPGDHLLSAEEKETIDSIWREHGHKETIPLCNETHRLPEYVDCYVEGTSKPIPYERIAKYSNNPARFRNGRAVISPEMAALMHSPFPAEIDL